MHHLFFLDTDDGFVVARHARVGDVCCTERQDPMIGGRNVRMGADHETDAAIAEIARGKFLAAGFAVKIQHDRVRYLSQRMSGNHFIQQPERIVDRFHE